jgi:hypothetical protein
MKEEKPVSIRSCRDDAQLSFRPTTTDKNPINLGLEKKIYLAGLVRLRPDTKGEHPGVVNKYSLGIWPIHK